MPIAVPKTYYPVIASRFEPWAAIKPIADEIKRATNWQEVIAKLESIKKFVKTQQNKAKKLERALMLSYLPFDIQLFINELQKSYHIEFDELFDESWIKQITANPSLAYAKVITWINQMLSGFMSIELTSSLANFLKTHKDYLNEVARQYLKQPDNYQAVHHEVIAEIKTIITTSKEIIINKILELVNQKPPKLRRKDNENLPFSFIRFSNLRAGGIFLLTPIITGSGTFGHVKVAFPVVVALDKAGNNVIFIQFSQPTAIKIVHADTAETAAKLANYQLEQSAYEILYDYKTASFDRPSNNIKKPFKFYQKFSLRPGFNGYQLTKPDKVFSLKAMYSFAYYLADRLEKLHKASLAHNDLTPGNVMAYLTKDERCLVSLVDFGNAGNLGIHPSRRQTYHYATPEQLDPKFIRTAATEVQSLAPIYLEMLLGERYYSAEQKKLVFHKLENVAGLKKYMDSLISQALNKFSSTGFLSYDAYHNRAKIFFYDLINDLWAKSCISLSDVKARLQVSYRQLYDSRGIPPEPDISELYSTDDFYLTYHTVSASNVNLSSG